MNCNVKIADVERMENVVGAALNRWHAEHGGEMLDNPPTYEDEESQ